MPFPMRTVKPTLLFYHRLNGGLAAARRFLIMRMRNNLHRAVPGPSSSTIALAGLVAVHAVILLRFAVMDFASSHDADFHVRLWRRLPQSHSGREPGDLLAASTELFVNILIRNDRDLTVSHGSNFNILPIISRALALILRVHPQQRYHQAESLGRVVAISTKRLSPPNDQGN